MEIIEFEYDKTPINTEDLALCLGFFDAVHLGHQAIINAAISSGYKVAVLTFDEPPAYVLKKRKEQIALTSTADKAEFLSELGVDYLYVLHFDLEVTKLTRYEFIDYVLNKINPKQIFCGSDYRFGNEASGNPTYLSQYFNVHVVDLLYKGDEKISSRSIIGLIKNGDVKAAKELIGRPYRLCGLVHHGLGNGKKLGFPTANIKLDYPYVTPKEGVYMGYGVYNDIRYPSIISIGTHPTLYQLKTPEIEIHFIDFDENIYGQLIFIEFLEFMRDNIKFNSINELTEQIKKDRIKVKRMLNKYES